jgi:hypothetical protein
MLGWLVGSMFEGRASIPEGRRSMPDAHGSRHRARAGTIEGEDGQAMHGLTAMLLGGILGLFALALGPAPSQPAPPTAAEREAEIRACEATCNQGDDETDRVTCKLNCKQATEGKDGIEVTRWKTEKPMGGPVPGQQAPPPPTTTVTTTTPRGTTTEVRTDPAAKVVQPPTLPPAVRQSPRQKYYFGLVDCQDRCNANPDAPGRARCKLRCLKLQPGPPPAG